jgi:hypothetical protein
MSDRMSVEQIEVRIWAFVIVAIVLLLCGAAGAMIYSVTWVEQPLGGMAPIDKVYTAILKDIMLLCVGVIGGVAGRKGSSAVATYIAEKGEKDASNDR